MPNDPKGNRSVRSEPRNVPAPYEPISLVPKALKNVLFSSFSSAHTKMCLLDFRFQSLVFAKSAGKGVRGRPIRHIFHGFQNVGRHRVNAIL